MNSREDRLYELLPVVHRMRDADKGYPLRALLRVAGEQINAIEDNISQLYDNWFIETCEDWVVPYLAELIGYRAVGEAGELPDGATALAKVLNPRREAANTIAYRRKKGTLALLELLANNAAGWPARAVEFYKLLGRAQNINHLQMTRPFSANLHVSETLDLTDGPFDRLAHSVDVRRINSQRTPGRYNIPNVGVFVWRLKAYTLSHAPANCVEAFGPHCYSFSALGNDAPLFNRAVEETDPSGIAEEINLPVQIQRRALEERISEHPPANIASPVYYGEGKSIMIYAPDWPTRGAVQPVPRELISVADLSDWRARPRSGLMAVDPVRGRMVFPTRNLPKNGVHVDYLYGFSADMGGGEYNRNLSQPLAYSSYPVSQDNPGGDVLPSINAALAKWRMEQAAHPARPADGDPALPAWLESHEKLRSAVVEIRDSAGYTESLAVNLEAGESLQIRAANRKRPIIRLLDQAIERPDAFTISGKKASRFTLDGILIAGRGLRIVGPNSDGEDGIEEGELCDVTIRHLTLVPGWWLDCDCKPLRPSEASIALADSSARLVIENSIVGAIHVTADERRNDPTSIAVSDSIIDATGSERPAICGPNLPLAFAMLSLSRCTVIGTVGTHAITLAENTIFLGDVQVGRRQIGCMRFCYAKPGSRTPRRHHCEPDNVMHRATDDDKTREAERVRPQFTSLRYGTPSYCQLALACADEIKRGADAESEMGAFHNLFQPQREAILRARLDEYTPADMQAGILFVS